MYLRSKVRRMIEEDGAFTLAVADNDPVRFEALNRMPQRELLMLCVAYLRRVTAQVQSAKKKPR
jgi:hypothetical protein